MPPTPGHSHGARLAGGYHDHGIASTAGVPKLGIHWQVQVCTDIWTEESAWHSGWPGNGDPEGREGLSESSSALSGISITQCDSDTLTEELVKAGLKLEHPAKAPTFTTFAIRTVSPRPGLVVVSSRTRMDRRYKIC
eukprot:1539623-Rhodomonas_salina.1